MKYKIVYDRNSCIGAAECEALAPDFWKVGNDGKAGLAGAKEVSPGVFELEIGEEEYKKQEEVASSCPAGCIRIEKVDD